MQTDLELLQKKRLEPVNERAHASHGMRKRPANSESQPPSALCADRLSQRSSRSTARILTDTGEVAIVSSAFLESSASILNTRKSGAQGPNLPPQLSHLFSTSLRACEITKPTRKTAKVRPVAEMLRGQESLPRHPCKPWLEQVESQPKQQMKNVFQSSLATDGRGVQDLAVVSLRGVWVDVLSWLRALTPGCHGRQRVGHGDSRGQCRRLHDTKLLLRSINGSGGRLHEGAGLQEHHHGDAQRQRQQDGTSHCTTVRRNAKCKRTLSCFKKNALSQ